MILDQTNRLRPGLLLKPTRHRTILPIWGGAHETRDGSVSGVLVGGVADADASPAERTGGGRGAVPESDPVVGSPRVGTYRAREVGLVANICLGGGRFHLSR